MRLVYLPVNAAWAFLFGDSLTRMGGSELLFQSRAEAVTAARYCGLAVDKAGRVSVA